MILEEKFSNFNVLTWFITSKCNFNCHYCFATSETRSKLKEKPEISLVDIERGFDSFKDNWIIHITGGEPFIKRDFIPICDIISKNSLLSINTNGCILINV